MTIKEDSTRQWDTGRAPASDAMQALIEDVTQRVFDYETQTALRKRKRKAADLTVMRATVSTLICDVAYRELDSSGSWIAVQLSKRKLTGEYRKKSVAFNRQLPSLIETMAEPEMGFIELKKGYYTPFGGVGSRVRAGHRLKDWLKARELYLEDLRRTKAIDADNVALVAPKVRRGVKGAKLPLPDTADVARYQSEMTRINDWLANADIVCLGEANADKRFLCRTFNGTMAQGGRLNGGFWQQGVKKEDRARVIRIDGSEIAERDFSAMGLRVAYSMVGKVPPDDDLYDMCGWTSNRPGVKKVTNALLASSAALTRFPQGTRHLFPKRTRFERVLEAITTAHPAIVPLIGTSAWGPIQFIESQVIVKAILRLIDEGVTALPLHDCLVVARDAADAATQAMNDAFFEVTGISGKVS